MGNIGMEILKFENAPAPRKSAPKKSNLKSLAGLATVAAVAVLGSTLAANISLGSGSALEFGQGVQTTSACDDSITLSPKVTFQNGANPQFVLSTISFSGLNASSTTYCQGKTLTLQAYGNTSATPLQIATNGSTAVSEAKIYVNSTSPTSLTGGVVTTTATDQAGSNVTFDLGFSTPSATSGAVYKLTLQSSN
jgi:hypothetical protein